MQRIDFIIVGQGIAGTSLAIRLEQAGKSYLIIDEGKLDTASSVSSGIMNPITGRRYVKSWMIDELLPEAVMFYTYLEKILGIPIIERKTILRGLANVLEENLWYSQSAKPDYKKYFGNNIHSDNYFNHFKNDLVFGEVKDSYRIDMQALMSRSRQYFVNKGNIIHQKVSLSDFRFGDEIMFEDYCAKGIIFAEGWQVINNPMFSDLPFEPVKGEVLICEIEDYKIHEIVKIRKFILPLGHKRYWIGSTNELNFNDDSHNPNKNKELIDFLDTYLNRSYKIIENWTGIRPVTKQRRPYIGVHPIHANVYLFNGLGTKGVSLAPYYTKHLVNHILNNSEINNQVNINRFYNS